MKADRSFYPVFRVSVGFVFLRSGISVNGTGGSIYQMTDTVVPACFYDVQEACQVVSEIGIRVHY